MDRTPTWVCVAPKLRLFPESSRHHAPVTEAHTHLHTHPPLRAITHLSDSPITHACTRMHPHTHSQIHIFNLLLIKPFRCMVSHSPQTCHPPAHIHPVAVKSHAPSHIRDSLQSPQTNSSVTGPPLRNNQSRTNTFLK